MPAINRYLKDKDILFMIAEAFILLLGLGWLIVGAMMQSDTLLNSETKTVLNTVEVGLQEVKLGNRINGLSIALIFFGALILVEAVICLIIAALCKRKIVNVQNMTIPMIVYAVLGAILWLSTVIVFGLWIDMKTKFEEDGKGQMIKNLRSDFVDDSTNSTKAISNSWNTMFIMMDCCAVSPVDSTTNDFDLTPWCTTSGECQKTNSQIPKTCCVGVTTSTYPSAPGNCHSDVESGTYNSEGCFDVLVNKITFYFDRVIGIGAVLMVFEVVAVTAVIITQIRKGH